MGNKYRNRDNRRKIDNKGRDEVNEGTMYDSDNMADIKNENVVSSRQIVRMKNPLQ